MILVGRLGAGQDVPRAAIAARALGAGARVSEPHVRAVHKNTRRRGGVRPRGPLSTARREHEPRRGGGAARAPRAASRGGGPARRVGGRRGRSPRRRPRPSSCHWPSAGDSARRDALGTAGGWYRLIVDGGREPLGRRASCRDGRHRGPRGVRRSRSRRALAAEGGAPRGRRRARDAWRRFDLHPGAAQLDRSKPRRGARPRARPALVVDGDAEAARPLTHDDVRHARRFLRATVPDPVGRRDPRGELELRADLARDALAIDLRLRRGCAAADGTPLALRAELSSEGQLGLRPRRGTDRRPSEASPGLAPRRRRTAPRSGILSTHGAHRRRGHARGAAPPGEPMHLSVTSAPAAARDGARASDLASSSANRARRVWRTLAELAGDPTAPIRGHVTGTTERALVFGRDAQGNPRCEPTPATVGPSRSTRRRPSSSGTRRSTPARERPRLLHPGHAARPRARRLARRRPARDHHRRRHA